MKLQITWAGWLPALKKPHWEWSVEKFYHHWFQTDKHILGLIEELGWSEQVVFRRPYTVMYHQGKFYPSMRSRRWLCSPDWAGGLTKYALAWSAFT
jgi:hypothetical protein